MVLSWERAGRVITVEEMRSVLAALEELIETGVFEAPKDIDRTDPLQVETEFEVEMLHKGVERLRAAAEPVLKDHAAEREAQQLRSAFVVIDGQRAAG
jgi:hypothetical protein